MIRGLIGAVVGLAVMVAAGYAAAVVYINNDGQRLAESYFQPWGPRGKVTFGSVTKSMFDDRLTISDITVQAPDGRRYKIKRIIVRDYDWLHLRRPRHADVTVQGAETTPAGLGPVWGPPVKAAGLDRLVATAHYRYHWDGDTKRFVIDTVRIDFSGLGVLTLSAVVELAQFPDFRQLRRSGQLLELGTNAKLRRASARFRNQALVRYIVQGYAAAHGLDPAEARKRLIESLEHDRRRARDPIKRDALRAAIAFIEKPGVIEAAAAPAVPVSLMQAGALFALSPREFKRTLGLKIEARPPAAAAPAR
jgi:hypothetical protein